MKKILLFNYLLTLSIIIAAQPTADPAPVLYGTISKEDLKVAPYDKWFIANYDSYQPDADAISSFKKKLNTKGISIQIFLGTWCGDSKREVPRFIKVLDEAGFPLINVSIIAVGGSDSLYKQSPQHEEEGKGVFRVPVFIVYRNGIEINRINEYPSFSMEKDLYAIMNNKALSPNYRSFEVIKNWLANGTLTDKNISSRSLSLQLKSLVAGENELNGLGYVLLNQGRNEEALKLFQANANLYPESANVISSLGEAYYKTGDRDKALQLLEKALELNKDPQLVREVLKIIYEVKGLKG